MDFLTVVIAIATLFVLIAVGFGARKYSLIKDKHVHLISHILVNVSLPALTIASMQVPETAKTMGIVDQMLIVAVACTLPRLPLASFSAGSSPPLLKRKGFSSSCWSSRTPCSWGSRWPLRCSARLALLRDPLQCPVLLPGLYPRRLAACPGPAREDRSQGPSLPGLVAAIVGLASSFSSTRSPPRFSPDWI